MRRRGGATGFDRGRERRAEARARNLLRETVSAADFEVYVELGFLAVEGGAGEGYAYLIYPHRPLVVYDPATGAPLGEYCVRFRDETVPGRSDRLPAADDVLAKWLALRGGERELIEIANVREPGWQIDPGQVRRDLERLARWRRARASSVSP